MSKEYLPDKLNPFRLAEASTTLHVQFKLQDMQRLRTILANDGGDFQAEVHFGIDQQGIKFMKCYFDTSVILQCQRCMENFSYQISGDFLGGLLSSESETQQLPEMYEPILVEDGMLSIQDVIEDELIVSLPIVPMHILSECKVDLSQLTIASSTQANEEESNPFKVIEILRKKKRGINHHQE